MKLTELFLYKIFTFPLNIELYGFASVYWETFTASEKYLLLCKITICEQDVIGGNNFNLTAAQDIRGNSASVIDENGEMCYNTF